jgi:excisionase family DNA binding protein
MKSPIAYSIPEACAAASIGRSALYEEIKSGRLRAVKSGRRTIVTADDLRSWVENLPEIATAAPRGPKPDERDAA